MDSTRTSFGGCLFNFWSMGDGWLSRFGWLSGFAISLNAFAARKPC
jgi:hypothetical protein